MNTNFQTSVLIKPFVVRYQKQIEALVLAVQNDEFKLNIKAQHQPDLPDLNKFYKENGGEFWVAIDATDTVLGCIGFEKLDQTNGALRKMFLKKEVRGDKQLRLAQRLYDALLEFAISCGTKLICLDTPLVAHAAHRFYVRNGWTLIPIEQLPPAYKLPKIDPKLIKFYVLNIT